MRENAFNKQPALPGDYPLEQMTLRPFQHQLAMQGIFVSPEAAFKLVQQKQAQDSKRYIQQELAKQGIHVSPDEALKISSQKRDHEIKLRFQKQLAAEGLDVPPDEADAILRMRFMHRIMKQAGITDPHEAIEPALSDDSLKPDEPNK